MEKNRQTHPFSGGVKRDTYTKKHRPLIWENMLGTVYARNPEGKVEYFDYNWDKAREFAQVNTHTDLRISKNKANYNYGWNITGPRVGQKVLFGIPKAKES